MPAPSSSPTRTAARDTRPGSNRRRFIRNVGIGLVGFSAVGSASTAATAATSKELDRFRFHMDG